jgi:small GTP-binding protein
MFKVIMVGTASVGKSNILLRYTKNLYNELQNTTIGVEFATKIMVTNNGTRIKLQLWDTAGQERYK